MVKGGQEAMPNKTLNLYILKCVLRHQVLSLKNQVFDS